MSEKKYACITGASSGIGREMARILFKKGYGLILAARREDRLLELSNSLDDKANEREADESFSHTLKDIDSENPPRIIILKCDVSKKADLKSLLNAVDKVDTEIFINNAGFGSIGSFFDTDLDRDENMIDVNIRAVHILTKEVLKRFKKKDRGYLLNVASSAGLMPAGPYMSEYYATKAYVASLTRGIQAELKSEGSHVYAGILAPGPVETEFSKVAGAVHSSGITAKECAECAIDGMFKRKTVIIPAFYMKAGIFFSNLAPSGLVLKFLAEHQRKKLI